MESTKSRVNDDENGFVWRRCMSLSNNTTRLTHLWVPNLSLFFFFFFPPLVANNINIYKTNHLLFFVLLFCHFLNEKERNSPFRITRKREKDFSFIAAPFKPPLIPPLSSFIISSEKLFFFFSRSESTQDTPN